MGAIRTKLVNGVVDIKLEFTCAFVNSLASEEPEFRRLAEPLVPVSGIQGAVAVRSVADENGDGIGQIAVIVNGNLARQRTGLPA